MLSLSKIRVDLLAGRNSVTEVVADSLKRIDMASDLNAIVYLDPDKSLTDARRVDRALNDGEELPLAGMTVVLKDNIAQDGWPLTCASEILGNFISPYDATATERLEKAGAVIVGRANMDEFGMGSSNEYSRFGPARNPSHAGYVPGGSSGGSAAAVAAGLSLAALGSDTGGSVRQPAAFCGVYGLRPTYGRVSRYGLVAFASSFDQIGPLARSIEDLAALFEIIAGEDPYDQTSEEAPSFAVDSSARVQDLRIGIPAEYFDFGLDLEIFKVIEAVKSRLEAGGAEFIDVSLPHAKCAIPAYYLIANAEASSNLARYDGSRYGLRPPKVESIEEMYRSSRSCGFGREVKRRIMLGTYALSSGYYDAYYAKAQKVRRLIRDELVNCFNEVDVLLSPVTPTPAFKFGEKLDDPLEMYLSDVFTVPASLAGVPSLSIPVGYSEEGLPLAAQLMGPHFAEETLFRIAAFLEKN